jgi:hypothetical protein
LSATRMEAQARMNAPELPTTGYRETESPLASP